MKKINLLLLIFSIAITSAYSQSFTFVSEKENQIIRFVTDNFLQTGGEGGLGGTILKIHPQVMELNDDLSEKGMTSVFELNETYKIVKGQEYLVIGQIKFIGTEIDPEFGGCGITSLKIKGNISSLKGINCMMENLDATALDALFSSLPQRSESDKASVVIADIGSSNDLPRDLSQCNTSIANSKGWKVLEFSEEDYQERIEISTTPLHK